MPFPREIAWSWLGIGLFWIFLGDMLGDFLGNHLGFNLRSKVIRYLLGT